MSTLQKKRKNKRRNSNHGSQRNFLQKDRRRIQQGNNTRNIAFDLMYDLIKKKAMPFNFICIEKIHRIHERNANGGRSSDANMYSAIKKFNSTDQTKAGVYAAYQGNKGKKKRIVFICMDDELM